MATVTVEGEQFKTYPQTYNTQAEAEEALSAIIVKKLGIRGSDGDGASVQETTQDMTVLADRVVTLIGDRQNGVWSTQIEKQYQDMFGEKLPSLWFQEVEAINRIRVDCPIPGRYIVFPVLQSVSSSGSATKPETSPDPGQPGLSQVQPSSLLYPEDELWDVFITCACATDNISMRLIGEDFSEKFEDLSSNMDLHYYDKNAIPGVGEPEVGKIYAAQVSSDWHRVKVVEVRGIECTCWFLDHGDEDKIPVEDLREIAPKFLDLPPQAVTMHLAGLEDFDTSETLLQKLNDLLVGKSLVGKVENRKSLGTKFVKSSKSSPTPRLVLFDTSSDDVDVNLNQKLIELLLSQESLPKLSLMVGEDASVLVSYVGKNGDIFVQKESSNFTMIEKMIVEQGCDVMKTTPATDIFEGKLYLAKYSEDGSLYRAEILSEPQDGKVDVFFVDYGNTSKVSVDEIWKLNSVSEAVSELPRQALKCRLKNVPPAGHVWSEEATKALRDLVPESQLVTVKVVGGRQDCPDVELILHNVGEEASVNLAIIADMSVFPESSSSQNGDQPSVTISNLKIDSPTVSSPPDSAPMSPMSSLQDIASLKTLLAPDIPDEGQYFDVTIVVAVSPSNFVVQPYPGEKLEELMEELNTFYKSEKHLQEVPGDNIKEGEYYAARHTDGYWYRVKITKMIDAENAAVRYVDYGDLTMVSFNNLQTLWGQFRNLPFQAINAKIANVLPAEDDWKPEDIAWFKDRVAEKQFVSMIKSVGGDASEPEVELVLIDTTHPSEDKYIDQELIQDGRARKA